MILDVKNEHKLQSAEENSTIQWEPPQFTHWSHSPKKKKKPLQIYHQQWLKGLGHDIKSQQKAEWIILLDTHSDAYTRPVTLNGHAQGVKCMNICFRKNHSV